MQTLRGHGYYLAINECINTSYLPVKLCVPVCAHVNIFSFLDILFAWNMWEILQLIFETHKT